ncbi:MAG: HPr family phosphocarrier protein [Chlamydiales bacterium]|nr:HPr family phosphocarrier protein [Chlamydiales bacterium]NCF70159.1 HPr family phosphocarrier protein [Chlamydiales bacterium]
MSSCSFSVTVVSPQGLHARPATSIVKLLKNFESSVSFTFNGETVNAKSVMNLLLLAAGKDSEIHVTVEGSDAESLKAKLIEVFEKGFMECCDGGKN